MENQPLESTLRQLQAELADHESLGSALQEPAKAVMQEIVRLLAASEDHDDPPTSEGLRSMLLEFEAEHPQLARTLGQIADGLQNMGI